MGEILPPMDTPNKDGYFYYTLILVSKYAFLNIK